MRPERGPFHGLDPSYHERSRPVRNIYDQNIVATFSNGDSTGAIGGSGGVPCNSGALFYNMVLRENGGRSVGNVGVAVDGSVSHSVGVTVAEENFNPKRACPTGIRKSLFQVGNLSPVSRGERRVVECGSSFFHLNDTENAKVGGKPYKDLSDTNLQLLTKAECRRFVQDRGRRNYARNYCSTFQQEISHKNLSEEKPNEGRARNWASHIFHLPSMQDVVKIKNRNASSSQVQFMGAPLVTHKDPIISSANSIDQAGMSPDFGLYFVLSNPGATQLGSVAGGNQQVTGHHGSELSSAPFPILPTVSTARSCFQERPVRSNPVAGPPSAQLTVFYAGAVNVFDDVPVDKANEIMLLAGNPNFLSAKIGRTSAGEYSRMTPPIFTNCPGMPISPSACSPVPSSTKLIISEKIESADQDNFGSQLVAHQSQANQVSTCTGNKVGTLRQSTPSTGMMSDNQPNITKALPQARKASLARFFQKRKERVRSKNPYSIIKPSPEQSLLERETISSPNCGAWFSHPVPGLKEHGDKNIVDTIGEGLASHDMAIEELND